MLASGSSSGVSKVNLSSVSLPRLSARSAPGPWAGLARERTTPRDRAVARPGPVVRFHRPGGRATRGFRAGVGARASPRPPPVVRATFARGSRSQACAQRKGEISRSARPLQRPPCVRHKRTFLPRVAEALEVLRMSALPRPLRSNHRLHTLVGVGVVLQLHPPRATVRRRARAR